MMLKTGHLTGEYKNDKDPESEKERLGFESSKNPNKSAKIETRNTAKNLSSMTVTKTKQIYVHHVPDP